MDKIDYAEIGRNIRFRRMLKDFSQEELGEYAGVSGAHISHVENARSKLSVELLINIANALEIDLNTLCGNNLQAASRAVLTRQIAEVLENAPPAVIAFILSQSRAVRQLYDDTIKLSD